MFRGLKRRELQADLINRPFRVRLRLGGEDFGAIDGSRFGLNDRFSDIARTGTKSHT